MSNYSFPKWTEVNIPPGPYFRNYRPKWDNYEFKSSSGRYFNNWHDAHMYQQLINAGYLPCQIDKLIGEKNPDFHFGISQLNNSMGNGYTNNRRGYTSGI